MAATWPKRKFFPAWSNPVKFATKILFQPKTAFLDGSADNAFHDSSY
jgi:hypothetical protein